MAEAFLWRPEMGAENLWAQNFDGMPFRPERVYAVSGFTPYSQRGNHALRATCQLVTVMSGICRFVLNDGFTTSTFTLDRTSDPLVVPPMHWRTYVGLKKDTGFFVLASTKYDDNDYIRSYEVFLKEVHGE